MKLVWWMPAVSLLVTLALTGLVGPGNRLELWLGMLGPLVPAIVSWALMLRQYSRRPEGLTSLMIKAFAAKMIFFAGYITVLVSAEAVQPIPFAISFAGFFIALHLWEAIGLRRLTTCRHDVPAGATQDQTNR